MGTTPVPLLKCPKTKTGRLVMRRDEGQHRDDDEHAEEVPPDADVVEQRHQPDAEVVQDAVDGQHDRVDDHRDPWPRSG